MKKTLRLRSVMIAVLGMLFALPAFPDYAAGLRAYRAGDYATAIADWGPLAVGGDANSQNGMGSIYQSGRGVQQDYQQAALWFRKAADHGLAVAQTNLGLLYASGRGVPLSREEALVWYQKAANQGFARAQNFLGHWYSRGLVVAQDYMAAEMWFSLSGPGTDQEDADGRAEVARHLTQEQMATALQMAQRWHEDLLARRATSSSPPPAAAAATLLPTILVPTPAIIRCTERVNCQGRWDDGIWSLTIRTATIQATASIQGTPTGVLSALIGVQNLGAVPINLIPSGFSLQMIDPSGTQFAALPPQKAMLRASVWDAVAAAAGGFGQGWSAASQRQTASATVTNPDGTTSRVDIYTTGPTQQEVDQQNRNAQTMANDTAARDQWNQNLMQMVLKENTLDSQHGKTGLVFFPREKKPFKELLLRLPITGTTLEFPFYYK